MVMEPGLRSCSAPISSLRIRLIPLVSGAWMPRCGFLPGGTITSGCHGILWQVWVDLHNLHHHGGGVDVQLVRLRHIVPGGLYYACYSLLQGRLVRLCNLASCPSSLVGNASLGNRHLKTCEYLVVDLDLELCTTTTTAHGWPVFLVRPASCAFLTRAGRTSPSG